MPQGSRNEIASTESGPDLISALLDETIHHVLGFLPAEEAVRTSVLGRGWRHHWKSMHSLQIGATNGGVLNSLNSVTRLTNLVDRVLLNRHVPLEECHINFEGFDEAHDVDVDRWIRHSVSKCHVRVLIVDFGMLFCSKIQGRPIVSGYLKRLELHGLRVEGDILDLSCCTALEDLRLSYCDISAPNISSKSVKRLMITTCAFYGRDGPTCISTPNIIYLKLDDNFDPIPFLDCMPLLETAFVRLFNDYPTSCKKCDNNEHFCLLCEDGSAKLLGVLSGVTHLELIAPVAKFTDWKCPTFGKLKTLLLNEWCATINLGALVSMLQYSPFLEKLTLQLNEGPTQTMLLEEIYCTNQSPAISKLLNVIEIRCVRVDERVYKIIKMLSTFDLQINIMRTSRQTRRFSFERSDNLGC
ncbi:F-box protein At5g03100-like isoform X2 [Lolium perenne]|uniref:F-box protein At5g03100-like isoform X2 n=1 Tax=Lolium perenne TaxID=4522 RepID=UPI0021F5A5C0|nr:F-box protein At5g03100-like isoform X2 [Lolium perenne]